MNTLLHQMVDSLVAGDEDTAKARLSQYFDNAASGMITDKPTQLPSPPEQLEEGSNAFDVYKDGKKIDTIFSTETDAADIKKSLIDKDGYDPSITVKLRKEKKK